MQETQRLAEEVEHRTDELSGLLQSAAVIRFEKEVTSEGVEATFAVFTLARHLLTRRLLPLLHATGEGRIAIVGVVMSERFKLDLAELERPTEPFRFYRAIAQNRSRPHSSHSSSPRCSRARPRRSTCWIRATPTPA
jgi:hypothetical protein